MTRRFLLEVVERAAKSFAWTLLSLLSGDGTNVVHVSWTTALQLSGYAALFSVLGSVASGSIGDPGTPSLIPPTVGEKSTKTNA